jgi:ABC-type antimicrobial peptide transport system permease subunit
MVLGSLLGLAVLVLSLYVLILALAFYVLSFQAEARPLAIPFLATVFAWPVVTLVSLITGWVSAARHHRRTATVSLTVPPLWGILVWLAGWLAGASFPFPIE